jgi:hypothetical protein
MLQQTSITEVKVFDGRKPKALKPPHISTILSQTPCEVCGEVFGNCDATKCNKLSEWLDE